MFVFLLKYFSLTKKLDWKIINYKNFTNFREKVHLIGKFNKSK